MEQTSKGCRLSGQAWSYFGSRWPNADVGSCIVYLQPWPNYFFNFPSKPSEHGWGLVVSYISSLAAIVQFPALKATLIEQDTFLIVPCQILTQLSLNNAQTQEAYRISCNWALLAERGRSLASPKTETDKFWLTSIPWVNLYRCSVTVSALGSDVVWFSQQLI